MLSDWACLNFYAQRLASCSKLRISIFLLINYLEKKIAFLTENIKIEEAKVAAGYGEEGDYLQVQLEFINTQIAVEQNLLEASTHFHTISLLSGWQRSFKYWGDNHLA